MLPIASATPLSPALHRTENRSSASATDATWLAEVNNPTRRIALALGLAFVFIQFTKLHEIISLALGFDTHTINLFAIPALVLMFLGGGIRNALRFRPARYWIGFVIFLILSVPFSSWPSASLVLVSNFLRIDFIILFIIGGLTMTWKEVLRLSGILALAAGTNAVASKFLMRYMEGDRIDLVGGTMGNANDFAALLVLLMPFLLWVVFSAQRFVLLRVAAAATFVYCLYFTLATGSRGAMIAVMVATAYAFLKLKPGAKAILLTVGTLAALIYIAVLPSTIVNRLATVFQSEPNTVNQNATTAEAVDSAEARRYLLWQSLITTVQHPLLGIGPGEFSNFEGSAATKQGLHGAWHETHNSYTQVSSEAGIPAALFMIAAIVSTYLMLGRLYKRVRDLPTTPAIQQIRLTLFCMLLSLVGFCTAIFFLSLAYRFYLPALTGMAIAATTALQHEPNLRQALQKTRRA